MKQPELFNYFEPKKVSITRLVKILRECLPAAGILMQNLNKLAKFEISFLWLQNSLHQAAS